MLRHFFLNRFIPYFNFPFTQHKINIFFWSLKIFFLYFRFTGLLFMYMAPYMGFTPLYELYSLDAIFYKKLYLYDIKRL